MAKAWYTVRNVRREQDSETGITYKIGDIFFSDGKEMRNHALVYCPRCGQMLRPGSINEGEGFHVDGCEGYEVDP